MSRIFRWNQKTSFNYTFDIFDRLEPVEVVEPPPLYSDRDTLHSIEINESTIPAMKRVLLELMDLEESRAREGN